MKKITVPEEGIETLFGSYDENLKHLETLFNVRIRTHGHDLLVEGESLALDKVDRVVGQLSSLMRDGFKLSNADVKTASDLVAYDMLDVERVARYIERGTIEIAPIAFMRGRTLNDSFVILDEAQNTTSEQMKMFLTRLGFGAKAVITGDVTQIDLPTGRTSGLVEAMKVVSAIDGISFVHFDERDVVRHKLVQQIVKAYEKFTNGNGRHSA